MEAVVPALAALLLCSAWAVMTLLRSRRSAKRSGDRAHLVEQALSRARAKQRTITDERRGDDDPDTPRAA